MKNFALMLLMLFGLSACAHVSNSNQAVMTVEGMVCEDCIQGLEQSLEAQPAIAHAKADLPTQKVTVDFKPGQNMDDVQLRALVKKAGYRVVGIERRG